MTSMADGKVPFDVQKMRSAASDLSTTVWALFRSSKVDKKVFARLLRRYKLRLSFLIIWTRLKRGIMRLDIRRFEIELYLHGIKMLKIGDPESLF